jgi:hypothetical protein
VLGAAKDAQALRHPGSLLGPARSFYEHANASM